MRIIHLAWLMPFVLSLRAYPQNDSTPASVTDTAFNSTDTIPVYPDTTVQQTESGRNNVRIVRHKAQGEVYKLKPIIDIPIVAVGTVWSLYAFTKIYDKTPPTEEQVLALNKNDIPSFDRWAVYPYSQSLDDISYYPFYAAMPLPLLFFLTENEMRRDYLKLSFLYLEAMSITGLFGTGATYTVDKFRPYAYTSETPMEKRISKNALNSFYAGHVEVVACPTFLIAKIYADYHPESNIKWVFYGAASTVTAATAYMRLRGGQHFPSDILLGTATGVLTGILVPHFHKTRSGKNTSMIILPYSSGSVHGIVMSYRFKK